MVPLASGDIPFRGFDIPGIDRIAQHVANTLVRQLPALWLWKERVRFQELLNVGLGLEAPTGESFQRLCHDRGGRIIALQHLPVQSRNAPIAIAGWRGEHGETVLQARLHPVECLLRIVDAVIVRHGNGNVLHKPGERAAIQNHRRGFERCILFVDDATQIRVKVKVPAEAIEVVDEDAVIVLGIFRDQTDHVAKAWATALAPGQLVLVDARNLVSTTGRYLTKARFLRRQAIAHPLLLL